MADANSVSDTQVLLQSMLQKLRLQPRPENISMHAGDKEQFGTTVIEQNGGAAQSPPQTPPMYNFDFNMDSKSVVTNLAGTPGSTGVSTSLFQEFAQGIDVRNSQMPSTPKQRALNWNFMSNHTVSGGNMGISKHTDDGMIPKQAKNRKTEKFSLTKKSASSLQSIESMLPSTLTSNQVESNIQDHGAGQKRWTQKVKEKWKERHKSIPRREQNNREKQEQNNISNSIMPPIPAQTVPYENTTTKFNKDVSVQHQPINNGSVEDNPSQLDHMSESLFSPGSFNLMEEIFTGQEWARFLPSSTISQSDSSSITQDQGMGLTSSISQSHQNKQSMLSQWGYRGSTDPNGGITESQMNSGGFHTEMFNQRKTPGFGQVSHNGQYEPYDSGPKHLEDMDLSVRPFCNNHPIKEQTHIYPYNQSNNTERTVNLPLSSEQTMEINHNQRGSVHEVLPVLDLSYFQSKGSSSLKKQVSLNRKRSHAAERRDSNERWRSETGDMNEWRNNSDPVPSLSPASSTSSLQYSISQDSESSVFTETVIKRRRVENTRHVRFADEVTIVPPLIFCDDDDGDADDEDYAHNVNEGNERNEGNEGNDDSGEELPSRPSVPRWIEALRSKTKRKPKLNIPRMRTKKYRFV